MAFPEFEILFRPKEPGQIKLLEARIEASCAETAGADARHILNLPPRLYGIVYIKAVDEAGQKDNR